MTEPKSSFPIALKLQGRRCLVVGEGAEAASRAQALVEAGAEVVLVLPRDYADKDLERVWLAVQTTRDAELAARLAAETEARQIFFCAVDQPAFGSFAHVAIARAGALFVAISSNGRAPSLARRLRELLQALFDRSNLSEYVERLAALRERTPPAERAGVLNAAVVDLELDGKLVIPDRASD
jgi:siroheme synthase-like protein